MAVRAEFHCYHCGYIPGHLEWDPSHPTEATLRLSGVGPGVAPRTRGTRLRCGRCGGPLYLDEPGLVQSDSPRSSRQPDV